MAYGKYRHSEIKGELGTTWYVEVWKKDYSSSSVEMNLQGEGFEVKWTGEGGTRNRQFLTSECVVHFYAESNADESFIYDVFEKGDKEYFVRIYKNSVSNANLWWFGWVQPSFDTLSNEPFPYPVKIIATDSIGVYKEREDDTLSSDFSKAFRINNHINDFGNSMSLFNNSSANESPIPQNHKWYKTGIDWFRNGDTYQDKDPFYSYYTTRAGFRKNIDKKPLKYKKYDVLKGSLQTFNTIGFLSDGHYYFIQPNNKTATDGSIKIYNYLGSDNEVASGGDIADESVNLTIDQSTNYILAGSTITYDPVLKSVSCDFINGDSTFSVPNNSDLTTGFSAGLLQGDIDQQGSMYFNFAATHKEVFNRNQLNFENSNWDLVNAGHKTTAQLQIKIGTGVDTRYLTFSGSTLAWGTDTTVHTLDIFRGKGVGGGGSQLNSPGNYVSNSDLKNIDDIGENLSLSGVDNNPCSIERNGDIYTAETSIKFAGPFPMPTVSGEMVITLTATNEYTPYYFDNPSGGAWAVDTFATNYSYQTPSVVTRTTESGSSFGVNSNNINLTGNNTVALNTNQVGLTFTTTQSNNDAFENLDLGEIEVGQTTSGLASFQDSIYSVQYNTGSDASPVMFAATQGFRANDTGTYDNILQLLTSEFLKLQTEPLEILQADVYSSNISPIKNLKYSINNDTNFKYYQFLGGTFKAQSEIMSGEWFKINLSTSVVSQDPDDINAGRGLKLSSLDQHTLNSKLNTKLILSQVNENSLGETNVAIVGGSATTTLTLVNNTRGKVYSGQKLLLTYANGSNPLTLTASSTVSTSVKNISVTSFTPELDYPTGSVLSTLNYDLTNVITGGGGTPGGSDTQVQFNDSGSFGGTDLLKITGANELTIGGTNTNTKLNAGADIILGADVAGGTSSTIQYLDSGSTNRVMLGAYATDIVVLSNRAANGVVQIRANTSTAGGSGELTIATFKDTSVDFLNDAELRGTNIGNIFDLEAYLTPVDFCMGTDNDLPGYSRTNGATAQVNSSLASLFATFQVPIGYEATHVQVNGSSTSSTFNVYACDVTNGTATSLTSSPSVGTDQALSSSQAGTLQKYLTIKFTPGSTTRSVYGAKITLARV